MDGEKNGDFRGIGKNDFVISPLIHEITTQIFPTMSQGQSGEHLLHVSQVSHFREGLMSYKEFIQELEDDVLPSEAEHRYQEYKSQYISTQKENYFNAHKDEEWLKDKYHPTTVLRVIERRNEDAPRLAENFLHNLKGVEEIEELDPDLSFIKSGPNEEIDFSAAPKAHLISSEHRRILADVQQALDLVRKLDIEKGIKDNFLCITLDLVKPEGDQTWGGLEESDELKANIRSLGPLVMFKGYHVGMIIDGVTLLDPLITYLWHVHGVDYYGMIETKEPAGFRHVRPEATMEEEVLDEETRKSGVEWEEKLDSFWQKRLNGQDPLEVMAAKEKISVSHE